MRQLHRQVLRQKWFVSLVQALLRVRFENATGHTALGHAYRHTVWFELQTTILAASMGKTKTVNKLTFCRS